MGCEFGQVREWQHDESLEWHVLQYPHHRGVQLWLRDLNRLYRSERALHERDFNGEGFEWIDNNDWEQSTLSFLRKGHSGEETILAVCNFTPVPRYHYRIGVPAGGYWREVLNSDSTIYGGSGLGNMGGVEADPIGVHGRPASLSILLPPFGILFFKSERSGKVSR